MKINSKMFFGLISLTGALLSTNAYSATYAGQDCVAKNGASLRYDSTGAKNNGTSTIHIACPVVRHKDGGTAPVYSVMYFKDDGKNKTCFFDNYNIDTGYLWKWTSKTGVRRLAMPKISPTKRWSPYAFNCSLPAKSKITGYYVSEH